MRVCVISRAIPPNGKGGLANAAWAITRAIRSTGVDVDVYTAGGSAGTRVEIYKGIKVYYFKTASPIRFAAPEMAPVIKAIRKNGPYSIIHSHSVAGWAALSMQDRPPVVMTEHGSGMPWLRNNISTRQLVGGTETVRECRAKAIHSLDVFFFKTTPYSRLPAYLAMAKWDKVIAGSEGTKQDLESWFLLNNVVNIPHCIYPEFPPNLDSTNGQIALCASDLANPIKGIRFGLAAVANTDLTINLIGPNPPGKAGVGCKIITHGRVTRKEVAKLFRNSDVFVDTSIHWSGFNTAVLEAMSVGTPVVGFDRYGKEAFVGAGGIAVPIGDVKAMREALLKVQSKNTIARKQAYNKFKTTYSPSVVGAKYVKLFEEVIRDKKTK